MKFLVGRFGANHEMVGDRVDPIGTPQEFPHLLRGMSRVGFLNRFLDQKEKEQPICHASLCSTSLKMDCEGTLATDFTCAAVQSPARDWLVLAQSIREGVPGCSGNVFRYIGISMESS